MDLHLFKHPDGSLKPTTEADAEEIKKLSVGVQYNCKVTRERSPKFHRKWFALARVIYDAWKETLKPLEYKGAEVEPSFDKFRKDLTIMAGFYEATYNFRGEVQVQAKSISFANMDTEEFEKLYEATCNVGLKYVLKNYKREDLDAVIEQMLGFAGVTNE